MRIALAQLTPTGDPGRNAAAIVEQTRIAAAGGARLVIAPEGAITDTFGEPGSVVRDAQPIDGPFVRALVAASAEHGIAVAAGTFVPTDDGRVSNVLIVADSGEVVAQYEKIHLYDAFANLESSTVRAGRVAPPIVELDGVRIGFATCYDLRFPELFRSLVSRGAQVLALSSAWVSGSGKQDHWTTLLRARAIENTSYVVAADQMGGGCLGRSMAFDPFGLPLLDLGHHAPAIGYIDIDLDRLDEVRRLVPSGTRPRVRIQETPSAPR